MKRLGGNGSAPLPTVPTPDRAAAVDKFFTAMNLVQDAFGFRICGDGLEIHDTTTGTVPAIITEDGALEIFTGKQHEEATR